MGFDVNEYAATRTEVFAESMVRTTSAVAPRSGEKATSGAPFNSHRGGGSSGEAYRQSQEQKGGQGREGDEIAAHSRSAGPWIG